MTTNMFDVSPATAHSGARIRKTLTRGLLVAAMTGGLAFGMAMPAFAGPTATTFTVTGGAIAVAVQSTATLTGVAAGVTTITGPLGAVTVTDARGSVTPWNLTVGSSTFISTPTDTESTSTDVTYATNTVNRTGIVTVSEFSAASIMTPAVVVAGTAVSGNNTATFNPTIVVTLPARALAGSYAGTVTTSVL